MPFVITRDPFEFQDRAWGYLAAAIERNVLATVLMTVLDGRDDGLFAYRFDDTGEVHAAALRTRFAMLTGELDPELADELIEQWLAVDPALPGANGPPSAVRSLAAAWRRRTGRPTRAARRMAIHELDEVVDPPRPPAGTLRHGHRAERDRLIAWWGAFAQEADSVSGSNPEATVDARLDAGGLFVWDDGGPVSLVAISPPVAGATRIGPVYTPPEHRRRGYAGMAVAEVSRHALTNGADRCTLFTDLENPTSNKIYAEVGYRRTGDWEEQLFEPPVDLEGR